MGDGPIDQRVHVPRKQLLQPIGMGCVKNRVAVIDDQPLANAGGLNMWDKATPQVILLIHRLPLHFLSLGHSL